MELNFFIIGLFLKFLYIIKVLLVNNYQFLKFEKKIEFLILSKN